MHGTGVTWPRVSVALGVSESSWQLDANSNSREIGMRGESGVMRGESGAMHGGSGVMHVENGVMRGESGVRRSESGML